MSSTATVIILVGLACFLLGSGGVWVLVFKPGFDDLNDRLRTLGRHADRVAQERDDARDERDAVAKKHAAALRLLVAANDRADAAEARAEGASIALGQHLLAATGTRPHVAARAVVGRMS